MNYNLPYIPERPEKARDYGLTMVMDKGLSLRQAEDLVESAGEYIDLVKLGFGTSLLTPNVKEKVDFYTKNNIKVYFGGTLFEVFLVRDMVDDYLKYIDKYGVTTLEVSDGSMHIEHAEKLEYINKLSKNFTVLSEIGSKQKGVNLSPEKWVENMKSELDAGSWKVIAESRESGTIGIYNADGSVYIDLINSIVKNVKTENIIWEAPNGKQQTWFIKQYGNNVNVGNIAPTDVIPLETLRRGVRGDTFFDYLPAKYNHKKVVIDNSIIIDFQI